MRVKLGFAVALFIGLSLGGERCMNLDRVSAASACVGAVPTTQTVNGQPVFVPNGQVFHVNIDITGLTSGQLSDIQAGISSWAGVSAISIVFDSSAPGPGVITVTASTTIQEPGFGTWSAAGGTYPANQITQGSIQFNLGYIASCSLGPCLAYDPKAANADKALTGLAAHEMGHVLGLNDIGGDPCAQTSNSVMGGECGTNNNGDQTAPPAPTSSSPTTCDQQVVAQQSTNFSPIVTPNKGNGGSGGGGGDTGSRPPGRDDKTCVSDEEWNDVTNTLTDYEFCS